MSTTRTNEQRARATADPIVTGPGPSEVDPLADIIPGTSDGTQSTKIPGGLRAPLWRLVVTSEFGDRIHPILGTYRFHRGIDFGARSGTPVRAAASGTIVWASDLGPYGILVVIEHGPDLHTAYGHLESTRVALRQHVRAGQRVGGVGSTGLATGPHLHFEVRDNGTPCDPTDWISAGRGLLAATADLLESRIR